MHLRDLWVITFIVSSLAAASPLIEAPLDQADGEAIQADPSISAIYGQDDRREIYQTAHPLAREAVSAVVMLTAGEDGERQKNNPQCRTAKRCNIKDCVGEVILKIQAILKYAEI